MTGGVQLVGAAAVQGAGRKVCIPHQRWITRKRNIRQRTVVSADIPRIPSTAYTRQIGQTPIRIRHIGTINNTLQGQPPHKIIVPHTHTTPIRTIHWIGRRRIRIGHRRTIQITQSISRIPLKPTHTITRRSIIVDLSSGEGDVGTVAGQAQEQC